MIKIFSPILLGLLIITSCKKGDFLDPTVTNTLNEESVFTDSARTMDALVGIYADIGFFAAHNRFGTSGLAAASDEAESSLQGGGAEFIKWATGSISAINTNNDVWPVCYANIRRVNVFFKKHLKVSAVSSFTNKGERRSTVFKSLVLFPVGKTFWRNNISG